MERLGSKVAVVTGAGSGIGRATAFALAGEGATVAVCDVNGETADRVCSEIVAAGGTASAHQVDVSSEHEMRGLVEAVLADHGVVDVVVNNAAIAMVPTRTVDVTFDVFRRMIDVNFWGVVYGSVLFLPHLLERPQANLVNIASNASLMAYSRIAPYTAGKFAVRGFTETLRMELRSTNVRVSVVCPGLTKTPMFGNSPVVDDGSRRAMQHRVDRLWGLKPEAVAKSIMKSIRRDRPRALVGPDSAVMDALSRVLPGAHSRILAPGVDFLLDKLVNPS